MMTIVTPAEWRQLLAANQREFSNGVMDGFEVNFDYLTSPWTYGHRAPKKLCLRSKNSLRFLTGRKEMRMFPTLEKILDEAAAGQLRGKQKVIIVPPELKPLVQKLVLLRWV